MKSQRGNTLLLIIGVVLLLGPFLGLLGTLVGMNSAFEQLEGEQAKPDELARSISFALWTTVAGILSALVGISLAAVALVRMFNTPKEKSP